MRPLGGADLRLGIAELGDAGDGAVGRLRITLKIERNGLGRVLLVTGYERASWSCHLGVVIGGQCFSYRNRRNGRYGISEAAGSLGASCDASGEI